MDVCTKLNHQLHPFRFCQVFNRLCVFPKWDFLIASDLWDLYHSIARSLLFDPSLHFTYLLLFIALIWSFSVEFSKLLLHLCQLCMPPAASCLQYFSYYCLNDTSAYAKNYVIASKVQQCQNIVFRCSSTSTTAKWCLSSKTSTPRDWWWRWICFPSATSQSTNYGKLVIDVCKSLVFEYCSIVNWPTDKVCW